MDKMNMFDKQEDLDAMFWLSDFGDIVQEYNKAIYDITTIIYGSERRSGITDDLDITIRALKNLDKPFQKYIGNDSEGTICEVKTNVVLDKIRLQRIVDVLNDCKDNLPDNYEALTEDDMLFKHEYRLFLENLPDYLDGKITLEALTSLLEKRRVDFEAKQESIKKVLEEEKLRKELETQKCELGTIDDFLSLHDEIALKHKITDGMYIAYCGGYPSNPEPKSNEYYSENFTDINGKEVTFYYYRNGKPNKNLIGKGRNRYAYTCLLLKEKGKWEIKYKYLNFRVTENMVEVLNSVGYSSEYDIFLIKGNEFARLSELCNIYFGGKIFVCSLKDKSVIFEDYNGEFTCRCEIVNGVPSGAYKSLDKVLIEDNFFDIDFLK